ncbi:serine/threonine protein kinase [Halapricum hydrolyticum]|uniref:Serine/threonine protein kinase n=1 Tax=Halapricum hydrolyticum TaxID=2979991 RepID=A0AAE3LHS2_9EURY|nr:serine/threonine protein kinase [Halapricum hydrolyticum]MCU4718323.1 serine/threonine protein kinase [Halapricum hydrolyticum]MCU4727229.1 serine/threonine protein kinase [Halapricum hydrolyticum]
MSGADSEGVRAVLADIIGDADRGQQSLPRLFGSLDSDDRTVRIGAACGICLIASDDPASVEYAVRRLVDRLDDDTSRPETILAFEYLVTQFPERVDDVLQQLREERESEPLKYTRQGGFVRSGYFQPAETHRDGVGRVRRPGEGTTPGAGLVYGPTDERPDERSTSGGESPEETDERSAGPAGSSEPDETPRQRVNRLYERVDAIVERSMFDRLMLMTGQTAGRYADKYRVLATRAGSEEAVSLRLFHEPAAGRERFRSQLEAAIEQWGQIDHEHVVSLYDGGSRPEPWGATQHVELTLAADMPAWNVSEAVGTVARLADGLAKIHQQGVIHGGIDPGSVAVELETEAGRRTRLDNVGLLPVYRQFVHPSRCLDPRFAAPEYFDASFGGIDQATDVYHLGAVLYYLLTSEPPYDGAYDEVRAQVPGDTRPTPPSAIADSPAELDGVVSKALDRQKLTRYETAIAFKQDLLDARERI